MPPCWWWLHGWNGVDIFGELAHAAAPVTAQLRRTLPGPLGDKPHHDPDGLQNQSPGVVHRSWNWHLRPSTCGVTLDPLHEQGHAERQHQHPRRTKTGNRRRTPVGRTARCSVRGRAADQVAWIHRGDHGPQAGTRNAIGRGTERYRSDEAQAQARPTTPPRPADRAWRRPCEANRTVDRTPAPEDDRKQRHSAQPAPDARCHLDVSAYSPVSRATSSSRTRPASACPARGLHHRADQCTRQLQPCRHAPSAPHRDCRQSPRPQPPAAPCRRRPAPTREPRLPRRRTLPGEDAVDHLSRHLVVERPFRRPRLRSGDPHRIDRGRAARPAVVAARANSPSHHFLAPAAEAPASIVCSMSSRCLCIDHITHLEVGETPSAVQPCPALGGRLGQRRAAAPPTARMRPPARGPAPGSTDSPRPLQRVRPSVVLPVSSCQCRVSCTMVPPAARTSAWRSISWRTARVPPSAGVDVLRLRAGAERTLRIGA